MYVRDEANHAPVLPVAIVGAALRFPGAVDPASYHEITSTGRRMFRELAWAAVDPERRSRNAAWPLFSLDGVPLRAALLDDGAPDCLDAGPAGRGSDALAALTTTAALTDVPAAGLTAASRIGAIIAGSLESGAGGGPHPSCSLAAVAAACEVLNSGELDLVLAGGVSTGIDQTWLSHRGRAGELATGNVRIYDTNPSGTLPGEGCGVVALMRAADARAAGLPAYAEIAGWHVATDGDPGPAALWPAYLRAGVDPMDVQFMEGHGAATAARDQAELSALTAVLGPHASGAPGRCALGAVTANIGDTRSAAGVAALLKTALAMTTGVIPATAGCLRPHRLLRSHITPFRLPLAPEPWPETPMRLAAVNSLGVDWPAGSPGSGPVHLVLRREPDKGRPGRRRRAEYWASPITVPPPRSPVVLPPRTGAHVAPPRPRTPPDFLSRAPASGVACVLNRGETGSEAGREPRARSG
jgi:acyl transferase domain-containing protein